MCHAAFGEEVNAVNIVMDALKTAPELCSTDSQLLLMEQYETKYGICNHDALGNTRPLALIGLHPAEDVCTNSDMYEAIDKFAEFSVAKFFGISFTEFMNLPRDVVERIYAVSSKRSKTEGNVVANALKELDG